MDVPIQLYYLVLYLKDFGKSYCFAKFFSLTGISFILKSGNIGKESLNKRCKYITFFF